MTNRATSRVTRRRAVARLALAGAAVAASGCGYALAGRGSFIPPDIKAIGIPMLGNRSTFFDVEQVLTEKLRTEFIGRGSFRVVPDDAGVDAVVAGEITGISVQPSAFNDQQLATRYLFLLTMRVSFTDTKAAKVLWSNDALQFRGEYELSQRTTGAIQGAGFLDEERSAFDRISTDVARTVATAILEAF
ncbi:MAG: LPS assembly lipoprotein LptE [Vicinamibacterales bacterium]